MARLRVWLPGALISGALLGAAGALALLGSVFARRTITPAKLYREDVRVLSLDLSAVPPSVRLSRGSDVALPGARYSYIFDQGAGHLKIGRILDQDSRSVLREVLAVDRGALRVGVRGRINGWWFTSPHELGLQSEEIAIRTELGDAPAWLVSPPEPTENRWAIHIHGRGSRREETLRGVSSAARLGMTSLVLSYRNDPEAPSASDGKYSFGVHESRDVNAAVAEAVRRGARRITLFGWSMGGTMSLIAAEQSEYRDLIDGIVLDSPAVDWEQLLQHHAQLSRVPRLAMNFGVRLLQAGSRFAGVGAPLDVSLLTPKRFGSALRVPTLIHTSPGDSYVPDEPVAELKRLSPELVTWRRQPVGEHVRLWNVDPHAWEKATETFLRELPESGASPH